MPNQKAGRQANRQAKKDARTGRPNHRNKKRKTLYGTLVIELPIHAIKGADDEYLAHLEDTELEGFAKQIIAYARGVVCFGNGEMTIAPDGEKWYIE